MDIVQSKRGHAVYATHIEDTCATGISTTRFFFTSLIASHSQAKRKESVPTYTVRRYSGGEPRFRAVRVDQSDLGDVILAVPCHIWHKKQNFLIRLKMLR